MRMSKVARIDMSDVIGKDMYIICDPFGAPMMNDVIQYFAGSNIQQCKEFANKYNNSKYKDLTFKKVHIENVYDVLRHCDNPESNLIYIIGQGIIDINQHIDEFIDQEYHNYLHDVFYQKMLNKEYAMLYAIFKNDQTKPVYTITTDKGVIQTDLLLFTKPTRIPSKSESAVAISKIFMDCLPLYKCYVIDDRFIFGAELISIFNEAFQEFFTDEISGVGRVKPS